MTCTYSDDSNQSVHPRCLVTCADPEGGVDRGSGPLPLKNHKDIGFFSNTGPDPLKNHKASKPTFNGGSSWARQRNAI